MQQNRWGSVAELNIIELNFLQHSADIGDTWLQVQPLLTSVTEPL